MGPALAIMDRKPIMIGTAQDVLLVREGRREILLPLVREVPSQLRLERLLGSFRDGRRRV